MSLAQPVSIYVLERICSCINSCNIQISEFLVALIYSRHQNIDSYRHNLLRSLPRVTEAALRTHEDTDDTTKAKDGLRDVFLQYIKEKCFLEMKALSGKASGFHLKPTAMTPEKLERFEIGPFVEKYRAGAKTIWELITTILQAHSRCTDVPDTSQVGVKVIDGSFTLNSLDLDDALGGELLTSVEDTGKEGSEMDEDEETDTEGARSNLSSCNSRQA